MSDNNVYMGKQVVDELLGQGKEQIGKAVLDYMSSELCPSCLEHKKWLTTPEAAFYLNISVRTLHNYCSQRKIKFQRVGKKSEFDIEWLKDFRAKNSKVYEIIE